MSTYRLKDPAARLEHTWDWSAWLVDGDTISDSSFLIDGVADSAPSDPLLTRLQVDVESNTTTEATAWLVYGVAGTEYLVTNHIETTAGRKDRRSIVVKVENR